MNNKFILLWLLFFALPGYAGQTILGRDGVQSVLLSPDGEHISVLSRSGDVDRLLIVSVTKKNTVYFQKTTAPQRIRSVAWVDDESLVLQLGEDVKYELEPQLTGGIEVLAVTGESMLIGGAHNGDAAVRHDLTGKKLSVVDGLASISRVFLVTDQADRKLWRVDLNSDSIETLNYPPFKVDRFSVSPNEKYMTAEGTSGAEEMRVMVWSDVDDPGWRDLDGTPEVVAISDSGIAFAIAANESGVAGLVSVEIETGTTTFLYQHESLSVDQVMVDSFNRPFAARFVPGLPSWFYFDNAQRLTQLHKSFRVATPQADFSFVSLSAGGRTIIAKQVDDDYPNSFFVVDTISGRADRLVESKSALSIIGGDEDDSYKLQPIAFESKTGSELSGYISLPQEKLDRAKPIVVMLRDKSDKSRWRWGFDEETWFFHRQGFSVLMLNDNPVSTNENLPPAAALMGRVSDVEDAIDWLVQADLADETQVCFFGRGTGAEQALLLALRGDEYDCAISLGGTFENLDLVEKTVQDNRQKNHHLHALLIYGADDGSANLASQEKMRKSLASFDIEVDTMEVGGERQVFASRQNEVRAFARISSFLGEYLERENTWPTLPLILEQALVMNALHEAVFERLEEGVVSARSWRRWFGANDKEVRNSLFGEQISLYESYQAEIIEMADGEVGASYVRFGPIRKNSGNRAGGRQTSE